MSVDRHEGPPRSRLRDRPGFDSGHIVLRFELNENLSPGGQAEATPLFWNAAAETPAYEPLGEAGDLVVSAALFRAFGLEGERGWAMLHQDSGLWEAISMEGSLQRHGKAISTISAGGAPGSVTLFYNDAGTETPSGIAVEAKNLTDKDVDASSGFLFLWYEPVSQQWYIVGSASGAPQKIVGVYGPTRDEHCLWPGKILAPPTSATSFCTDQYTSGADCLLLVLNFRLGSDATSPVTLAVGDEYPGVFVCNFGEDNTPVYAIRVEDNYLHKVTIPSPGVGPNASISITLPTGETVSALNWSAITLATGDKAICARDLAINQWLLWKTAGGSSGKPKYHITLPGAVAAGGTLSINLPGLGPTDVVNWSPIDLYRGDPVLVYQDDNDDLWYLVRGGHPTHPVSISTYTAGLGTAVDVTLDDLDGTVVSATNDSNVDLFKDQGAIAVQDTNTHTFQVVASGHPITNLQLAANVLPGAAINVTLPDAESTVVSAINYSAVTLFKNEKVHVYQNLFDSLYYLVRTGPPIFHVVLPSGSNINVGQVIAVTLPDPDATSVNATNWSGKILKPGSPATVYQDLSNGNWYIVGGADIGATFGVLSPAFVTPGNNVAVTLPAPIGAQPVTNASSVDIFRGQGILVYQNQNTGVWYMMPGAHPALQVTMPSPGYTQPNSAIDITLDDADSTTVTATNWGNVDLFAEQDVFAILDPNTYTYGLVATGHPISFVQLANKVTPGSSVPVTLSDTDSTVVSAVNQSQATLFKDEFVTVFQNLLDGGYYLVRSGMAVLPVAAPSSGVNAGATGTVTLPDLDATVVAAKNTGSERIPPSAPAHVYQNPLDGFWYFVTTPAATQSPFLFELLGAVASGDFYTAFFPFVSSSPVDIYNHTGDGLLVGENALAVFNQTLGIWEAMLAGGVATQLEGYLLEDLSKSQDTAMVLITNYYLGFSPFAGFTPAPFLTAIPLLTVKCNNYARTNVVPWDDSPYLFQGKAGALIRAVLDRADTAAAQQGLAAADDFSNTWVYRFDWVECPPTLTVTTGTPPSNGSGGGASTAALLANQSAAASSSPPPPSSFTTMPGAI